MEQCAVQRAVGVRGPVLRAGGRHVWPRPEGAEEAVTQVVMTSEETERLKRRIAFTLEDEAADLNALEERKKAARKVRFAEQVDIRDVSDEDDYWDPSQPSAPSQGPVASAGAP